MRGPGAISSVVLRRGTCSRAVSWVGVACAAWLLVGCATRPQPDAPPVEGEAADLHGAVAGIGTVTYLDFEGGFYGIVADDGARYDPLNLDEAFHEEGLRVRFRVRLRTDVMSIHMWGKPAEVVEIVRLEGRP